MRRWRVEIHDEGRNHVPFNKYFDDLGDAKRYVEKKQLPRKNQFYRAELYETKLHNKPEEWYMSWDKHGKVFDRGHLIEEKRKREEFKLLLRKYGLE